MVGELLRETTVQGADGFLSFLDGFVEGIAEQVSLNDDVVSNIVIGVSEALNNAYVHGNSCNENLNISLSVYHTDGQLSFLVKDQGRGYDYELIDSTISDGLLDVPGGRGLFIMKALADEVTNNDDGNEVCLIFNI